MAELLTLNMYPLTFDATLNRIMAYFSDRALRFFCVFFLLFFCYFFFLFCYFSLLFFLLFLFYLVIFSHIFFFLVKLFFFLIIYLFLFIYLFIFCYFIFVIFSISFLGEHFQYKDKTGFSWTCKPVCLRIPTKYFGTAACVCVCIPILVTTFPEWLSGTEPLPHTPGAVRPSLLCV